MQNRETNRYAIDWWVLLIYLVLIGIGWINIYSATYSSEHHSIFDIAVSYGRQMIWIISSIILAFIIILLDPRIFPRISIPTYGIILFMLIVVLGLGSVIGGSKSWIDVGAGIRLQPSEFAKYGVALVISKIASTSTFSFDNWQQRRNLFLVIFFPAALVLLQGDTGSAVIFGSFVFLFYRLGMKGFYLFLILWAIILFVATLLIKQMILLLILLGITSLLVYLSRKKREDAIKTLVIFVISVFFVLSVNYIFDNVLRSHQKDRINVLIGKDYDPRGSAYNVDQSLIAIGSGGFSGKGFLNGTQTKYDFVPEQSTDFIFCTVGEEWGFIGSVTVLLLYLFLLIRLVIIAERQRSDFSTYYAYAVIGIFFIHFFVNIGMTIALVPVIGIPLPFISYGGSSLWAFTIMLFTLLKLDMHRNQVI
ncbi:MAG: rod shape-determining protein RodA [Marinilabiliales bacterium]|nr:MAG: rod shape-determining protein RodA [Marinilabiliales bacterium]